METSPSIKNLTAALVLFQSRVGTIIKDATNPYHKSKYATLGNILDKIKGPLLECGVWFIQTPDGEDGLTTRLFHLESQEYVQATYNIRGKSDPQALGSAITYAKRYSLVAMLVLNIDDDDDGNAGSGVGDKAQKQQPAGQQNGQDDKPWLNEKDEAWKKVLAHLQSGGKIEDVRLKYKISKANEEKLKQQTLQTA